MIGLRRHVAWPDIKFLEQKFYRMQSSKRSEQEIFLRKQEEKDHIIQILGPKVVGGGHLHMRPLGQNLKDASPASLLPMIFWQQFRGSWYNLSLIYIKFPMNGRNTFPLIV